MKIFIVLLTILSCAISFAKDIDAVTASGKSVVLHENGKWEYAKTPASNGEFDFRKTRWGMNKADVKKTESGKIEKDSATSLIYSGKVAGLQAYIVYVFVDDKLVRTKYAFTEKHTNQNEYISDFDSIKKIINSKYTNPIKDKTYWLNDLYEDDYDNWGMAISVGHLSYLSKWESGDTRITLLLTGDNYEIDFEAEYLSIKLEGVEKAREESEKQEQF